MKAPGAAPFIPPRVNDRAAARTDFVMDPKRARPRSANSGPGA